MNSVERVKAICKERKIPISRLEKDLGYANGYIGQLRKGVLPDDRLSEIANYLSLSVYFLMTGEKKEKPTTVSSDGLNQNFIDFCDKLRSAGIDIDHATERDFQRWVRIIAAAEE